MLFLGVIGIVALVLTVLAMWFLALWAALSVASVPSEQTAPALMAGGPASAAVVLGASEGPPWLVLLGVGVALPIWLLARHATGLTAEVGWRPHARRVQRMVVAWSSGTSVAVVGVSVALYVATAGTSPTRATAVAATTGVALLSLWLLGD